MTTKKDPTRKFSLEEDFMNYNTDDLLFGLMYSLATYNPNYFKLYLSKKKMVTDKKIFYNVLGCDSRTLKNHLKKLIDKKLVQEEEMYINNEKIPVYTFPCAEKGNFKYQIIDKNMLNYLIDTRNRQAIRIYVYLLSCYLWKKEKNDYFIFSNRDILKALGYSTKSDFASKTITNILDSLKREGVINYDLIYVMWVDDKGKEVPSPRMKLTYIAQKVNELKKV